MLPYDAWLVDLDGTLYRSRPLKLKMLWRLLLAGPRVIRILRQFRREHEALREQGAGYVPSPYAEQLTRTAARCNVPHQEVVAVVERYMFEVPSYYLARFVRRDLLREIAAFREGGGKTALVSDYPACQKLAALGATTLFDQVVASGEPDGPTHLKPSPDGMLLAAARLGVEPARCLVLGDRADADGAAAAAAGMAFRRIQ
jgi:beta-phosphoglucomutase-like phosphatase (HAD superfamily)